MRPGIVAGHEVRLDDRRCLVDHDDRKVLIITLLDSPILHSDLTLHVREGPNHSALHLLAHARGVNDNAAINRADDAVENERKLARRRFRPKPDVDGVSDVGLGMKDVCCDSPGIPLSNG